MLIESPMMALLALTAGVADGPLRFIARATHPRGASKAFIAPSPPAAATAIRALDQKRHAPPK
jgi:hypothetical protein